MEFLFTPSPDSGRDTDSRSSAQLGGKAANLLRLNRLGLPVPRWFCVTADAFDSVFRGVLPDAARALDQTNWEEPASVAQSSQQILRLFRQAPLPEGLEASVQAALREHFPNGTRFAVRSSALSEDSTSHSFAGQLETYLHVPAELVLERVRECWASGFSARALAYSMRSGLDPRMNRVGVVIQEMVESVASGVLFLADPRTGDRTRAVVVAGYGLGEGIVSDQVETDTLTVSLADRRILTRDISTKLKQVARDPSTGAGTFLADVPPALRRRPAISDPDLATLVDMGAQVSEAFGHPQDIEWAIDALGGLHLTQARPITTLGGSPATGPSLVFDNSNIVESYPGITTPLTASFIQGAYARIFREALEILGIPRRRLEARQDAFEHMLGFYEGRVYYNLTSWYHMFRVVPFIEPYIAVWEEMMGIGTRESRPSGGAWLARVRQVPLALRIAFGILWNCVRIGWSMDALGRRFDDFHDAFWRESRTEAANLSLWQRYASLSAGPLQGWGFTLLNDGYTFVFSAATRALLRGMGLNPEDAFNGLLCGEEQMESIDPLKSMLAMAAELRAQPGLTSRLRAVAEERDQTALDAVLASREDAAFAALFRTHLEKFGDRGVSELKLETLTFREDPILLLMTLLPYVESKNSLETIQSRELEVRARTRADLRERALRHPLRLLLLRLVLPLAKRGINYRESSRLDRTRVFGIVRSVFRAIGRNLVREGALEEVGDIFYLTIHEVDDRIHGASSQPDLRPLIRERKLLEARYRTRTPPERLHFRACPYSAQSGSPSPAADEAPKTPEGALAGIGCAPGRVTAEATIVLDPMLATDIHGKILIAPMTDPGWVFLMVLASGLVVEKGSILSHTAIIGRELGIPTLVGVKNATRLVREGQRVTLDGRAGRLILDP